MLRKTRLLHWFLAALTLGMLAALFLAACASTLPLTSVDPLPIDAVLLQNLTNPCGEPNARGAIFRYDRGDKTYQILLYAADQHQSRFLLLDMAEGDDTPVWLGVVGTDGQLIVRQTMTYGELMTKFPSPCTYFTQQDA